MHPKLKYELVSTYSILAVYGPPIPLLSSQEGSFSKFLPYFRSFSFKSSGGLKGLYEAL